MTAPLLVAFCEAPVSGPLCLPVTTALASPAPNLGTVASSVFVPPKDKPGGTVKTIGSGQHLSHLSQALCFLPVYPFKTYYCMTRPRYRSRVTLQYFICEPLSKSTYGTECDNTNAQGQPVGDFQQFPVNRVERPPPRLLSTDPAQQSG